jgi:hypothetical protein
VNDDLTRDSKVFLDIRPRHAHMRCIAQAAFAAIFSATFGVLAA